jgi:GNAT superfamily N-acetyltransferase
MPANRVGRCVSKRSSRVRRRRRRLAVQIVPLAYRLDLAPTLARWHYDEWRDLYGNWSSEVALAELQGQTDPDRVPTTLVALSDEGELLGSVSLLADDLPECPQLSPWLASLFVRPDRRGQGLGGRLVEAAVSEARRLGASRLYLFTPHHEAYYAARGWSLVERATAAGQPVVVMGRFS